MVLCLCSLDSEWDTLMEVHHESIEKNYQLLEEIGKYVLLSTIVFFSNFLQKSETKCL